MYGYSLIALQQANLYSRYPSIYWNTACLTSEAGVDSGEDFKDLYKKGYIKTSKIILDTLDQRVEEFYGSLTDEDFESMTTEDIELELETYLKEEEDKEKTKASKRRRDRVAEAISNFQLEGVNIGLVDINESGFGFVPDEKNNIIKGGFMLVNKLGDKLVLSILEERKLGKFTSIEDFLSRTKVSRDRVCYLIKAGAFNSITDKGELELLHDYVMSVSNQRTKLTMQNANMLIQNKLIPESEFSKEISLFNWVAHVRKSKLDSETLILDDRALKFYYTILDESKLENINNKWTVSKSYIETYYKTNIAPIKHYIINNMDSLLDKLNAISFNELWEKYGCTSIAEGQMQSMFIYIEPHPLTNIKTSLEITSLRDVVPNDIIGEFLIKGKIFPKYNLSSIVGTVIGKDKLRNTVTILTPSGPVKVKYWKDTFSHYDQAVVELNGPEKVLIQDSFFKKGTYLLVTGSLREDTFYPKKYKNTPVADVTMKITLLDDGQLEGETKFEV